MIAALSRQPLHPAGGLRPLEGRLVRKGPM